MDSSRRVRLFEEHPVFDALTLFDTQSGRLEPVDRAVLERLLPPGTPRTGGTAAGIERYDHGGHALFTGTTSEQRTRFPRRIYFQITRKCNLGCAYCFLDAQSDGDHVPTEAALEVARFMGRNGLLEVRLTGGEPTTHPDFLKILDAFRSHDVYVSVATNGVMSRRLLDALAEREHLWVICSVDGSRATHEQYRPGTFETIVANLSTLKQRSPDIRLRLTTVLTRRNMKDMRGLGLLARSLDAESVTVIPLRPQVRDGRVLDDMLTATEFKQVLEDIVCTARELGIRMTTTLGTVHHDQLYGDPIVRKRHACAAGREATNLDYDARRGLFFVYGCAYSPAADLEAAPALRAPFLAGEFPADRVEAFQDIWLDEEAWAIYRSPAYKWDACQDCTHYTAGRCVGSCPIQNIDYSRLHADQGLLAQLREQLSSTAEWYCYKWVLGD